MKIELRAGRLALVDENGIEVQPGNPVALDGVSYFFDRIEGGWHPTEPDPEMAVAILVEHPGDEAETAYVGARQMSFLDFCRRPAFALTIPQGVASYLRQLIRDELS